MLNLAIECSGIAGSVALFDRQHLLAEIWLPSETGSVRSLAATVDSLLSQWGQGGTRRVDLISVTNGPGSFTGLRVGLATAQMLALAWKIPIAPVDTLAAIALGVLVKQDSAGSGCDTPPPVVIPVLNAFRKQVFVGAWSVSAQAAATSDKTVPSASEVAERLLQMAPAQVVDAAHWQAEPWLSLNRSGAEQGETARHKDQSPSSTCSGLDLAATRSCVACGPGLRNYPLPPKSAVQVATVDDWDPTASSVGILGWNIYEQRATVSAHTLRPNYVRRSAAEEGKLPAG